MRCLALALVLLAVLAAGCNLQPSEEPAPADPLALVYQSAQNIRALDTFRLLVEATGAPYQFGIQGAGAVTFRRAVAQYVAPDILQATVRILFAGLPAEVVIFSEGDDQWYRNEILTGGNWLNAPFSPGFNPKSVIADDSGIQASIEGLTDLTFVGEETLETGVAAYHFRATANGDQITALLANLVTLSGPVTVGVYVDRELVIPVRFVIVQPETATEDQPDPTTWTIDVYDVNQAPELDHPRAESTAGADSATAESTAAAGS